jgi:hypothetical protein
MQKIQPSFQFKFEFRAEGRDETHFPVGSIVDQFGKDLFPNKSFRDVIKVSPNGVWVLLFQYRPAFMVLLNLETKQSYPIGLYESPESIWVGPQSLKWVHTGINDIRESSYFGCSPARFNVNCEHTAGGAWTHPIQFIEKTDFSKFATENESLLLPGKNRKIWYTGSFDSAAAGWEIINANGAWTSFYVRPEGFMEIVPRGQIQTFICRLQDLEEYLKIKNDVG